MAISNARPNGYGLGWYCDLCNSRSRLTGQTDRWFCDECRYDICFECYGRTGRQEVAICPYVLVGNDVIEYAISVSILMICIY